ncbi:MAG: radical SAM protein [Desulfuromonadaceae bacterium]|nr:radical SAM protein [Desulfuromonadaceae bacterium]
MSAGSGFAQESALGRQAGEGQNDKFSVSLDDGCQVEAVWYPTGTLCLSTQVGCAMGCPFCASGRNGLLRSLGVEELHHQLATARLRGHHIERITLSGIGEPLQALTTVEAFVASVELPVSVTTSGQPLTALKRFLMARHNGLMLSVHAGTAAVHRQLVPRGPDFEALWRLLAQQWPLLSRRRRRKIGINYLLLAGVNDTAEELAALTERLQGFPEITLHLLTWNPVEGQPWRSPGDATMAAVADGLRVQGLNVRLANRWRRQALGGCGTLVSQGQAARPGTA